MTAPPRMNLDGKSAVVTGGARGIGLATAESFVRSGARVMIADKDGSEARKAASHLGNLALGETVDVTNPGDIDRAVASALERFGSIDILVNNAGVAGGTKPVADLPLAEWESILRINLTSVFLFSKAVLSHMIGRKRGRIVNVASISGKEGNPDMAAYSVSKAGIICLTKALSKEVATHGIFVNCVSPAVTRTTILETLDQASIDYMAGKVLLGRVGEPREIASVIHFLASDEASFVTGQCYDVSGGRATY